MFLHTPNPASKMAEWTGPEDDQMRVAFTKVFGSKRKHFGNAATQLAGYSDDRDGVQWHAGHDLRENTRWAGINLEGRQYDRWPIARLIERELKEPSLPSLIEKHPQLRNVTLMWQRDYWQATARPEIQERDIGPTPMRLADLTRDQWHALLTEARNCLDSRRKRLGRATQTVTLADGTRIEGDVSPHLMFRYVDGDSTDWETLFRQARELMQPLHDWAVRRAVHTVGF